MRPYLDDGDVVLHLGDCVEVMREMDAESVDAIVTDPPYGLEFMGKEWDGANGFRRSLNPADVGRDDVFGRASRTSPEYRAGRLFGEWCETWAVEALRVLRPGGHLLSFGGTRTYHRLTCAIEDAGFEVRDCLVWLHGSGFPKSLDVSKAIDRAAGAEREVVGQHPSPAGNGAAGTVALGGHWQDAPSLTAPATPEAAEWQGWGTALKPAHEPVVVARKPLAERTVAAQVLATGTGALNIDGCRIEGDVPSVPQPDLTKTRGRTPFDAYARNGNMSEASGRWPANVALDEHAARALGDPSRFFFTATADGTAKPCADEEVSPAKATGAPPTEDAPASFTTSCGNSPTAPSLPGSKSTTSTGTRRTTGSPTSPSSPPPSTSASTRSTTDETPTANGSGAAESAPSGSQQTQPTSISAGRGGFCTADAGHATSRASSMTSEPGGPLAGSRWFYTAKASTAERDGTTHPTTKPLDLMRWLVRLVTPPEGVCLDPFAGSGTTLLAARQEGFRGIGIEREPEYAAMAAHRLRQLSLFGGAA